MADIIGGAARLLLPQPLLVLELPALPMLQVKVTESSWSVQDTLSSRCSESTAIERL